MSKKETNETQEGVETMKENELVKAIEAAKAAGKITEDPTLKAIAAVFGISPNRIYSVAKQPKAGEVYDAHVYNWDAIERFVSKRLDDMTMDEFIEAAIEKDKELKSQDRRTGTRVDSADRFITTASGLMPKRKYEFEIGQKVLTKKDGLNIYEVVMMTPTHMVLQLEGTGELKVFANWTANSQIIPPTRFEETLAKRKEEADKAAETDEIPQTPSGVTLS